MLYPQSKLAIDRGSISALLPPVERFSPLWGGAVSRWCFEVFNRLNSEVQILSQSPPAGDPYPYPFVDHPFPRWSQRIDNLVIRKFWPSGRGIGWCSGYMPQIWRSKLLIIENRPGWARLLRILGYRGTLAVHLHNVGTVRDLSLADLKNLESSCDWLIACCQAIADDYREVSPSLYERTLVVRNGVDTEFFEPHLNRSENNEIKILYVGRISPAKGIDDLLESVRTLSSEFPVRLQIAGGEWFGPSDRRSDYENSVAERADALARHGCRVDLLGYQSQAQLRSLYQACDVLCSPSKTEAMSLVLLEGMSSGACIVATKVGGTPEALGEAGLLVEPSASSVTEGLRTVLSDSGLRDEFGKKARSRALEHFTWAAIARDTASVFEKMLRSTRHV